MAKSLVKLKLHGLLGEQVGSKEWDLAASSIGECIRFVQMNTKKLYKNLLENDQKNIKYSIIINGRKFTPEKKLTVEDPKTIFESELAMKNKNLKTVDIIPVFEGADSDTMGIILIVLGVIVMIFAPYLGFAMIMAGVAMLLAKPPKFDDFREIEQGGKTSYLFSGPQNIVGEGGPVPLGYGKLLVGSQVVSAAYVIRDFSTADTSLYLRDEYGNLTYLPKARPALHGKRGGH